MSRTPYDEFSKQFLEELLSPFGEVEISKEVPGEARQVDVWFSPAPQNTPKVQAIGLLGQMAVSPCLLEPFRNPPTPTEVRNCLLKLFLIHAELQRQARRNEERIQEATLPRLWILASSASESLLHGFRAHLDEEHWSSGIYFLGELFKAAVVAINQLPQTEETLWLRILGKGRTQQQAIAELIALPREHPLRSRTLDLLLSWSISIEDRENLDEEERVLIMQLSPLYRERLEQQLEEGRQEGQQIERRTTVETLLRVRFGSLDAQLSNIIEPIVQLPSEDYALLLLQLSNLSREDLLVRFQD